MEYKADDFNQKFYNLTDECIDALYKLIRDNNIAEIDFEKSKESIRVPYAVFSDGDEIYVNRDIKRIEFFPNDWKHWVIKVTSEGDADKGNEYAGYITKYGSENIESDGLFDLYRGAYMAIAEGYIKKLNIIR